MRLTSINADDVDVVFAKVRHVVKDAGYVEHEVDLEGFLIDARRTDSGRPTDYDRVVIWLERNSRDPLKYADLYLLYGRYEEIVAREFALKRYIRAHSAEKYLVYHSTIKRPCGQIIVVDDGYDLFLSMILYPNFGWDEPAYHLEGDPEGRTFAEVLVDVVATEVIEPWGGGKWHMEIFRSANHEPEDWNGEM